MAISIIDNHSEGESDASFSLDKEDTQIKSK